MKPTKYKLALTSLLVGLLLVSAFATGFSQETDYPERPITLIEPWPAGGWGFTLAQEIAPRLEEKLGVRVNVQLKTGGTSTRAHRFVANAEPDGYTLLYAWVAGSVMVPLQKDVEYDMFEDYDFLAYGYPENPVVAVTRSEKPYDTLAEFIEYANENPDKNFTYAGGPRLSIHSLDGYSVFRDMDNVTPVYYGSSGQASAAMFAGHVDIAMDTFSAVRKFNNVKALAVFSDSRVDAFPDVPTAMEQGVEAAQVGAWGSFIAPAGLPDAVHEKLVNTLEEILTDEEFQDTVREKYNLYINYKGPEEFEEKVRADREAMRPIIETLKEE